MSSWDAGFHVSNNSLGRHQSASGVGLANEQGASAPERPNGTDALQDRTGIANAPAERINSGADGDSNSSDGDDEGDSDFDDSDESEHEATQDSPHNGERSSESGSEESLVTPLLDAQRRQLVDRLMVEFRDILRGTITLRGCPSGDTSSNASSSARQGSRQNNSRGPRGNQGRGGNRGSSGNDDETREDGRSGQDSRASGPSEVSLGRRFACPYFKRDPRKHREHRSCVGPGWTTVHRVKYLPNMTPEYRSAAADKRPKGACLPATSASSVLHSLRRDFHPRSRVGGPLASRASLRRLRV